VPFVTKKRSPASAHDLAPQQKAALASYGLVATAALHPAEETIMIKHVDVT
jgi:hypothetical protein